MFLPLFLAILLGLVSPSATSTPPSGAGTTVNINSTEDGEICYENHGEDGDDTGGEKGHIHPKP